MLCRVAFVIPYVGGWPKWSQLFFESCRCNSMIRILVICECPPPFDLPGNVEIIRMSRIDILKKLEQVTGLTLDNISGHKLCDFRPFFGLAFSDLLSKYEFWGYCDIDMMFGDLGKILTNEFLDSFDAFSAHDKQFVGHFTILRNIPAINQAGFEIDDWKNLCKEPVSRHVDEERFSNVIAKHHDVRWAKARSLDEELETDFSRFGITFRYFGEVANTEKTEPPLVQWENGCVHYFDSSGLVTEVIYIHFMGLKRNWHWNRYDQNGPFSQKHVFSRIGYGGVSTAQMLNTFPWRQLYGVQKALLYLKKWLGFILKSLLPQESVINLRRWLKV